MAAAREVVDLIERFERNRDTYRSSEYNEAQVRLEFIDPFFKALGWDMYNEAGTPRRTRTWCTKTRSRSVE